MEITCEIAERTPGATGVEGAGKPVGTRAARPSKAHNPAPASFPNYPLKSAKLQTHCLKMPDFQRFLPNGSALWQLHHLKSRPHRHRTRDIASLEIEHADETPIACFKCGETPTTAGAEGTVRPEGTAAVPVGGGGAWLQRPGVMTDTHSQNFARNFPWSVFN